jgi:PadR family transcriptional regulator PadR
MVEEQLSAWLRGVLDLCLLGLLDSGEAYGYELSRRLRAQGIGPVPGGSLYPALLRLEKVGHLQSQWRAGQGGPGRKYYALTPSGREALDHDRQAWRAFCDRVDGVLAGSAAS